MIKTKNSHGHSLLNSSKAAGVSNGPKDTPFKSIGNLRKNTAHTTIYIGNLSYTRTKESIRTLFQKFGGVSFVNIILDKGTARSKGFGFVQMKSQVAATKAIAELNGSLLDGRTIKVSVAVESDIAKEKTVSTSEPIKKIKSIPEVAQPKKKRKRDKGLKVLLNFLDKA